LTMPEGEVDLNLDVQTVCMLLEQLEALASSARLMVDTALRDDELSTLVSVEVARPLVEELHKLSEGTVEIIDDFEQKYASEG
jgi:hypothetical protein